MKQLDTVRYTEIKKHEITERRTLAKPRFFKPGKEQCKHHSKPNETK